LFPAKNAAKVKASFGGLAKWEWVVLLHQMCFELRVTAMA
jgi:hypothetical protein